MTKLITLLFILSLQPVLLSQKVFRDEIGPCKTFSFSLECDSINAHYNPEKLLKDICYGIKSRTLNKLRGTISIQIIVDTLGTPCVMSIENNLNYTASELGIVQIIHEKTFWSSPLVKGHKQKVSAMIRLTFKKNFIALQRLGFSFTTKWHEIDKYIWPKA